MTLNHHVTTAYVKLFLLFETEWTDDLSNR